MLRGGRGSTSSLFGVTIDGDVQFEDTLTRRYFGREHEKGFEVAIRLYGIGALRTAAWLFLAIVVGCGTQPSATRAPSPHADVSAGRQIAQANCGPCHAVAPGRTSPLPDAPEFADIARRWPPEYLEEALAEGIVVGHEGEEMPEFVLEPADIDALTAYLRSLTDE